MPVVYEEMLSKEIKSGKFSSVYLIFGDDSYLKKFYFDKICKNAFDGDEFFNFQKFDGDSDLQEVYNAVVQFPFMSDKKCVAVTDFDFEHASKSDFDRMCEIFESVESGCTLVLRFDTVIVDAKKSAKAKKIIAAAEKCGGCACQLDHRNVQSLVKTLVNGAEKRNFILDSNVARYMIETVGDDISLLQNELEKLANYSKGNAVDKSTVDKVCVRSVEASVYDYVNEIISCNLSGALSILDDMFYMHVEPMIILYTASGVYVDMYRMFSANKGGVSREAVAQDFAYKNRAFLLGKANSNLKKFDRKRLDLSFDALLCADSRLKSFAADSRTVLEQLTVKLIYIVLKGDAVD